MEEFPDYCLRGLTKNDIGPTKDISSNVFYPDERTGANRADGGMEKSINWEDDDTVVSVTLREYPTGYARISRVGIHAINNLPGANGCISYERSPQPNNKYHGNIVYKSGLTKSHKRAIASSLILACVDIHIP